MKLDKEKKESVTQEDVPGTRQKYVSCSPTVKGTEHVTPAVESYMQCSRHTTASYQDLSAIPCDDRHELFEGPPLEECARFKQPCTSVADNRDGGKEVFLRNTTLPQRPSNAGISIDRDGQHSVGLGIHLWHQRLRRIPFATRPSRRSTLLPSRPTLTALQLLKRCCHQAALVSKSDGEDPIFLEEIIERGYHSLCTISTSPVQDGTFRGGRGEVDTQVPVWVIQRKPRIGVSPLRRTYI